MAQVRNVKRSHQQMAGAFISLVSLGGIALVWYTAVTKGYILVYASMVFPAFFFIGLAIILFKDYKLERVERGEDISEMEGWKLITARWWVVLVLALSAGIANYVLLSL